MDSVHLRSELRKNSDLVVIRNSPIHGLGGFARNDIPPGKAVMEYLGEIITKEESLRRCIDGNHFIFALDDQFDLDGSAESNPARFLNHSCAPNCEARLDNGRIWIVSSRPITAGDELTFDYGYDLESYREHPCHCGAADCARYIVAQCLAGHVRQQQTLALDPSA